MKAITEKDLYGAYKIYVNKHEDDPTVDLDDLDSEPNWMEIRGDEAMTWSNRVVEYGIVKVNHGDAVHWLGKGYRNEGLLFWDSTESTFVWPHTEIDDYGSVPPNFKVGNGANEFSPNHWIDTVDHNSYVFVSSSLREEIEKNLAEHVILRKNGRIRETFVKIRGQQYKVIVHGEKAVSDVFAYDVDEGVPTLYTRAN